MRVIKEKSQRIVVSWRFLRENGKWTEWYWKYARTQNYLTPYLKLLKKGHCVGELWVDYRKGVKNEASFKNKEEFGLALGAFLEQPLIDYLRI